MLLDQAIRPDGDVGFGCVVDVETTGGSYADEVIELAAVLFAYDRKRGTVLGVVDEYVGLREPGVPINPFAYRVHRLSLDQLRGHRLDYDRVESILLRAEFIIAHNASFDRRFVSALSETAREKAWLCSMRGIDWAGKGYRSRKLSDLLAEHGLERERAHRALDDVRATLALLGVRHQQGTYLQELL
ncbi:MAG TPA: exonuclease domain-containing protein [Symbiobacteriaceae bacterium]|nr:exonuclease domain-containing protein [Symbiobacteriaceae bacterium]